MAGAISLFGAQELLGNFFGRISLFPAQFYVALALNSAPNAFMGGNELDEPDADWGYTRTLINNDGAMWSADNETISNAAEVRFSPATVEWGTVRYWALCNADTAGSVFFFGDLGEEIPTEATDVLVIPVGTLNFSISGLFLATDDDTSGF